MRAPVYLTAAILSIAFSLGWLNHHRLKAARENLGKLTTEVHKREMAAASQPGSRNQDTKRPRQDGKETVRLLVISCFDFQSRMKALGKQDSPSFEQLDEFMLPLWEPLESLDSESLKSLISKILEEPEISKAIRQKIILAAHQFLALKAPLSSLDMLNFTAPLFKDDRRSEEILYGAFFQLSDIDPMGAARWIRKNSGGPIDFNGEQSKNALIRMTARKNPRQAFQLFDELDVRPSEKIFGEMVQDLQTTQQKLEMVVALRDYCASLADETLRKNLSNSMLKSIAHTYRNGNLNELKNWFESARLTPGEISDCIGSYYYACVIPDEVGMWLEYSWTKLPLEASKERTRFWVNNWTTDDYRNVGEWLASTPAGPMKNIAVRAYAEMIVRYQPQAAEQWAMTIPDGEYRDSTLKQLYYSWPKTDAAGREAFVKRHGME
ncbi:hypothetical protein JIN84_10945 [Luteolibacter yonseiensis]|uniref:Uncharacterized protein n=1 Tax=Luteolibacter yonseiensis TaxID=1144680 RepID=A0A934R6H4_9BACT|nr:hypothetical protein [Luteolibacter yonseiensis]MBK1816130.1 hypothetical protein [Luteolibacter yonseiensis]